MVLCKGLAELSADRERREQNADRGKPKRGVKEVRGKGGEPNFMSGVNNEREQEPRGGGGRPQRERGVIASLP